VGGCKCRLGCACACASIRVRVSVRTCVRVYGWVGAIVCAQVRECECLYESNVYHLVCTMAIRLAPQPPPASAPLLLGLPNFELFELVALFAHTFLPSQANDECQFLKLDQLQRH